MSSCILPQYPHARSDSVTKHTHQLVQATAILNLATKNVNYISQNTSVCDRYPRVYMHRL